MNNDVSHSTVMRLETERGSRVRSHERVATARNVTEVNYPMQTDNWQGSTFAEVAGCSPVQICPPTFPCNMYECPN
jgi:hypothetical protein